MVIFPSIVCVVEHIFFQGIKVSLAASFCFSDEHTDGRTDTMFENNDHLFGHGLVGQYTVVEKTRYFKNIILTLDKSALPSQSLHTHFLLCRILIGLI